MKKYSKQNDTALKGLELLLLLTQNEKEFNETINSYSVDSVEKYLNTFNLAGLEVQKKRGKYSIKNIPLQLDLTTEEIEAFLYLETTSQGLLNTKMKQEYETLFNNLKKYFSTKTLQTYNLLKEKSNPEDTTTKEIQLNNIEDDYFHLSNTIVFELYGRLIKNYRLKDSETIIDSKEDRLIISNSNENKRNLIRRLLRYGENCKVLKPENFKNDFANTIEEMIKNLERNEA